MASVLFIFHFRPIENYPPVQNLINVALKQKQFSRIYCVTSKGKEKPLSFNNKVKILRLGNSKSTKFKLWLSYILFAFIGVWKLIVLKPRFVLYYETLSMYPVYFYKRYINNSIRVCIHYHEYVSKKEFERLPGIEKIYQKLENFLYQNCSWISQTNEVRLDKFLKDKHLTFDSEIHHELPNFPSEQWAKQNTFWKPNEALKIVYVGYSLTEEGSYLKELIHLLSTSAFEIQLNLYCFESNTFVEELAGRHGSLVVNLHAPKAYSELPNILKNHHVGLILYKAKTDNYLYNAPNKLFEYLSCGLDVWYPEEMQGIHSFDSKEEPRVIRLNFSDEEALNKIDIIRHIEKRKRKTFFAEEIYGNFFKTIKK